VELLEPGLRYSRVEPAMPNPNIVAPRTASSLLGGLGPADNRACVSAIASDARFLAAPVSKPAVMRRMQEIAHADVNCFYASAETGRVGRDTNFF